MNKKDSENIYLVDVVGDLIKVCKKYGIEKLFIPYINEFIVEMRGTGLIHNDREVDNAREN